SEKDIVRIWNVNTGEQICQFQVPKFTADVKLSPDGSMVASFSREIISKDIMDCVSTVSLWDSATGKEIRQWAELKFHRYSHTITFSPDGKVLASGGAKRIEIRDVASGQLLRGIDGHKGDVLCLAFSPNGKIVASVGCTLNQFGDRVHLWD